MPYADKEQENLLKQGVWAWNTWRDENPAVVRPNLRGANLRGVNLEAAKLSGAILSTADLSGADLSRADLRGAEMHGAYCIETYMPAVNLSKGNLSEAFFNKANLYGANLNKAKLKEANLTKADLRHATLVEANLARAVLSEANLSKADLRHANLMKANISEANLSQANLSKSDLKQTDLSKTDLRQTDLSGANLSGANLTNSTLVKTNLTQATLSGCSIFGISVWKVNLAEATQTNLVITDQGEPTITVDNLQVAQFIYLLLNNVEVRQVIDTLTSKTVLILGRFITERKAVLDALREELRKRNYLPILFDFDKPASRDLTETISTLAHMARFVIADITDAKSIPQELQAIVPHLPSVPIRPIIERSAYEYGMFEHFKRYPWVLQLYQYEDIQQLHASLIEQVISPAEAKVRELHS